MTHDVSDELDHCMALISDAAISDELRAHLTSQSTIYAQFLSDLEAGRLQPGPEQEDTIRSMLELIRVFCSQIGELLAAKVA